MIPVYLTLEGLYSYNRSQEIDFTRLIDNHLFGIFGQVGSGKSTIIEAIMIAVYNESDRLSRNDDRYNNMMNLQSNRIKIDYHCKTGLNSGEDYRFLFEVTKTKTGNINSPKRKILKKIGEEWVTLYDKKINATIISEIVGMDYENFKKTIIIPQGTFQEFIFLGKADRAKMLQKLFKLDQFDLSGGAKRLKVANETALHRLEGKLDGGEVITREGIDCLKKEITVLGLRIKPKQDQLQKMSAEAQKIRSVLADIKQLQILNEHHLNLNQQSEDIAHREHVLARYESAVTHFQERLIALVEGKNMVLDQGRAITRIQQQLKHITVDIEAGVAPFLIAEEAFKKLDQKEQRREQLKSALGIQNQIQKLKEIERQITTQKASLLKLENEIGIIDQNMMVIQNKNAELKRGRVDIHLLHEIDRWFQREGELQRQISGEIDRMKQQEQRISDLFKQINHDIKGYEIDSTEDIDRCIEYYYHDLDELIAQRDQLQIKKALSHYSNTLKPGSPCYLCGSDFHPAPIVITDLTHNMKDNEQELGVLKGELERLKQGLDQLRFLEQNSDDSVLERLEKQLKTHQSGFIWAKFKEITPKELERLMTQDQRIGDEINDAEREVITLQKERDLVVIKRQGIKDEITMFQQEQIRVDTVLKGVRDQCSQEDLHADVKILNEELEIIDAQIGQIERRYQRLLEQRQVLMTKQEQQVRDLQSAETLFEQINLRWERQEHALEDALTFHNFKAISEVEAILATAIDIPLERRELEEYSRQLTTLTAQIDLVQGRIKGVDLNVSTDEREQQLLDQIAHLKDEVNQMNREEAVKSAEIKRLLIQFQDQKESIDKLEKLQERAILIKEMEKLFKGRGFVDYVSGIYLRNLVGSANERFLTLSRNQLALELNDDQEFVVRDYLNNGSVRLLKTLSGGQIFQAAFSLALALADNVRVLNNATESFFFIDEGFGSLDQRSLRLVFDTLKSLRYENRIVGVISHVEALQHEVDLFLKIKQNQSGGSQITRSWENGV